MKEYEMPGATVRVRGLEGRMMAAPASVAADFSAAVDFRRDLTKMESTMHLSTYLNFNGQCAAAFKFYEQCLGGKLQMMMTYGESPMAEQVWPESRDKIMHVTLAVGDGVLMGCDAPPQHYEKPQGEENCAACISGVALILDILDMESQAARTALRSGRSVSSIAGPHRSLRARARSCTMC